jgi:hypothetical protein
VRPALPVATMTLSIVVCGAAGFSDGSIPDSGEMKQRVANSLRRSESALENYSCLVREHGDELNADNSLKTRHSSLKERFYVNGVEIEHTLEKDGKPLSASDAKKEQERVDKNVKRFSNPKEAQKLQKHQEKQADMFLRALELTNGRREASGARSTLLYDLAGDPQFHPKNLEERFAQALSGTIAVDEESGTPVDLHFRTTRDVKIGAGLLANLHKGFWLRVRNARQPDGVWLTRAVEGSGDARAALFVHARFRFKEELDKCHLFSVETQETVSNPASSQN